MATLMLIGGSGFFGKSILDAYGRGLLSLWGVDKIIVIARSANLLSTSHPNLINETITLLDQDIATASNLTDADFVIHAAASTDAANYLENTQQEKLNIQSGILNYCKLAKKYHRNAKIIYCSSGAVYGQQPADLDFLSEENSFGDLKNITPIKRDYAAAKRDAENAILGLAKSGLRVSIGRCFAFVGPYLPRDKHFAIGNFLNDGINGRPIVVQARHLVYRSYMYADDLVVWLMTLVNAASVECKTINIGSDEAIDLGSLAIKIANYFQVPAEISSDTEGDIDRYVPSIRKAREELNLDIKFDLSSSIIETVNASLKI